MPVTKSYFISAMPRTGGHLLCEALESTGIAGNPTEYFEPDYETYWCDRLGVSGHADYFEKVLAFGSTPNGVFGSKVIWPQLEPLKAKLGLIHGSGISDLDLLQRTFPDLRFIWLKRRDKVRQAISYYKAVKTDIWHSVKPDSSGEQQPSCRHRLGPRLSTTDISIITSSTSRNPNRVGVAISKRSV